MGCTSSEIDDITPRLPTSLASKCIVVVLPPAFDIAKFVKQFKEGFDYRFMSVGKLIRDEINKNTQYSQVILENLEQHKHINQAILQILLKNIIFHGNFIIQFCPKKEEVDIWKRFIKMVDFQFAVIINPQGVEADTLSKPNYPHKFKEFQLNKQRIYDMFAKNKIIQVSSEQAHAKIYQQLQKQTPK